MRGERGLHRFVALGREDLAERARPRLVDGRAVGDADLLGELEVCVFAHGERTAVDAIAHEHALDRDARGVGGRNGREVEDRVGREDVLALRNDARDRPRVRVGRLDQERIGVVVHPDAPDVERGRTGLVNRRVGQIEVGERERSGERVGRLGAGLRGDYRRRDEREDKRE